MTGLGQVVAIASGKGGVGKSTIAAGIAASLTSLGRRVLLIDCDAGLRNLDLMLGIADLGVYNLADVLAGRRAVAEAAVRHPNYPNLYFISASTEVDDPLMTEQNMQALLAQTAEQFDHIILDCPAGIEQGFQNAIAGADRALVVTTPEVSAIRDADRIIGLLEANGFKQMDLIINRLRMDMVKRGDMMSADDVVDILAVPLIGIVPDDENVVIATNQGEPLVGSDTPAGKAYRNVVDRVLGKEIPFLDFEKGVSFWTKVTGIFRKA